MSIGTAANFKIADVLINGRSTQRVAKRPDPVDTGGGGVPEWVPANAKIYIDLVGDRAWTETDGEVAINTLLGADADTDGWDSTSYSSANLSSDGYAINPVAFIGQMETVLLGETGATCVVRTNQLADGRINIPITTADQNWSVEIRLRSSDSLGVIVPFNTSNVVTLAAYNAAPSINVLAFTLTRLRLDLAINGVAAITKSLTEDIPVGGFDAIFIQDSVALIQTITIYDALPSTAGLSALSEPA